MTSTVKVSDFQQAMAALPGGITAVTTLDGAAPAGIIATAVCSLSAEPPSIVVCVNKNASVHDAILRSRRFAVNLLAADQHGVAQRFRCQRGSERFDAGLWSALATGAPILVNAALALDCTLLDAYDGYTHTILVGAVQATQLPPVRDEGPLLWHERGYARSHPLQM
jgi:flavin reductase